MSIELVILIALVSLLMGTYGGYLLGGYYASQSWLPTVEELNRRIDNDAMDLVNSIHDLGKRLEREDLNVEERVMRAMDDRLFMLENSDSEVKNTPKRKKKKIATKKVNGKG